MTMFERTVTINIKASIVSHLLKVAKSVLPSIIIALITDSKSLEMETAIDSIVMKLSVSNMTARIWRTLRIVSRVIAVLNGSCRLPYGLSSSYTDCMMMKNPKCRIAKRKCIKSARYHQELKDSSRSSNPSPRFLGMGTNASMAKNMGICMNIHPRMAMDPVRILYA